MELTELTAYAEEKFHIREQHKWADFPGFSVLADPNTGKWVALLMRQWDFDTGTEIQRCDIKCGQQSLSEISEPYLSLPFRMKGKKWVGVIFCDSTDPDVIFRLFDRAVYSGEQRGHTIVLDETPAKQTDVYRDTALPFAGSRNPKRRMEQTSLCPKNGHWAAGTASAGPKNVHQNTAQLFIGPQNTDHDTVQPVAESRKVYQDTALGFADPQFDLLDSQVPDRIRKMLRLYEYKGSSFTQKCRNFYRQGKFMEDYEDNAAWTGEFRHYFPTYHNLNVRQLRGYFTWRTHIRKGDFSPAATSFAYLYLYELLNGIGTSSPEDALKKMREFETGYLDSGIGDPAVRKNLHRWMLEYAVIHEVSPALARRFADPEAMERDDALAVLKAPGEYADEEVFSALGVFAGKKLEQTPVVRKGGEKGKQLFAEVWRYASKTYFQDGKDLFAACFGEQKAFPWYPLGNAVYWEAERHRDTDYALNACRTFRCRGGAWREERYDSLHFNRNRFRSFLRETDRLLRKYRKTGHYLRENPDEAWAGVYVEAVLEIWRQREIEAARPKITINLSDLEQIRQDARLTRDSLLTEEEMDETGEAVRRIQPPKETAGDAVRENVEIERGIEESRKDRPAEREAGDTAGEDGRREEEFAGSASAALDQQHMQTLQILLKGESPETYCRAHHLMPSVVTDAINEAFFDEIGDNILECDGDAITVVEDYRDDILQMLGGKNR